jgi:hypothetical protein
MKAAIISALVAAVVSAGSATAAIVVTSKNIKNGTIQPVAGADGGVRVNLGFTA